VRQNNDDLIDVQPGARVRVVWNADHVYEVAPTTDA
jgi:hypothetical protein